MDKDFDILYKKAKELAGKKILNKSITYAHVGCALLTEMLKNNESRIKKIVAVGKTGAIPPCGRCRELMKQLNIENLSTQIMTSDNEIHTLNELLPQPWINY